MESIEANGGRQAYNTQDLEALHDLKNYQKWILDYFRPYLRGSGIEFGAGMGGNSVKILPFFDTLDLVEPSPNLIETLHDRFDDNSAVSIIDATLENHISALPNEFRDSVILINVLEHIEKDAETLCDIFRILKPGGHLLLFVPALPQLFSEMDRVLCHFRRYYHKGLRELVENAGFTIVKSSYFDLLGIVPWFLVNTLGRQTTFNQSLAQLYDSIGVPFTRTMENYISPPIGKNVILVAQRPGNENDV